MQNTIIIQLTSLMIFFMSGIVIGILFDIFRILRKSFKTPDIITYIEDICFWLLTGSILLYLLFKTNDGEIRLYNIIGIITGNLLYMIYISKYFIKINVKILLSLKKICIKIFNIIFLPIKISFKFLKKILKPISFLVINIKKSTFNILSLNKNNEEKIVKSHKNKKNTKKI